MIVYSRWGEKVFESNQDNPAWDGIHNGEPATADVYIYRIDVVNDEGDERIFRGDVTLIR